ncbi:DUF3772 domain-containing protein [Roseicyclus mahoneyensis]|uniref:Small-conductance mechanosensitive channel n=1 Tax=Roseicyclus mahoneyensis TaxID=164332 RepID=A0A316GNR5_9RHOB|nr:DUF3772 domain-containing protein [Roseicyclus mahoneyensis]PWK62419.1 small-conductance mechanosensitive channel [Roseicyclus mahoneyensis]
MIFRTVFAILLSLLLLGAAGGPLSAQAQQAPAGAVPETNGSIDYSAWQSDAQRAETLIEAGIASTAFLTNLRGNLVGWRARFLAAQGANASRIETIQAQITALGAPPAEGASEPATIAERRTELAAQLAEAQVPRVTATEAFNRANGLIGEIDAILAARQARALLERDPAPINPLNWGSALAALGDVVVVVNREIEGKFAEHRRLNQSPWDRLPFAGVLALVALALMTRSRFFVGRWTDRLQRQVSVRKGRIALAFLVSLLQVLLPITGLILLGVAVATVDVLGRAGTALLTAGIGVFVSVFSALWLAGRLFPANEDSPGALGTPTDLRPALRRAVVTIGVFLGLGGLAETFSTLDAVPLVSRGVFVLPVYLGLAWGFYRLAALLRRVRRAELAARAVDSDDGTSDAGFAGRTITVIGQALRLVAIAGPILAAAGYLNLTGAIMTPTATTLGLIGLILALQAPVRDLYSILSGKTYDESAQALLPVLVNLLLIVGLFPVVALTWGMRPEQLGEFYDRLSAGFQVGDTRITPGIVLAVVLVFTIGLFATRLLQGALRSTVLPRTRMDVGARNAVTSGIGYVGIALAAVIAITTAGIDLTALGVVLGALSVGIGFGLQNVVNNFVSGIILLIERPISEGDWIEVGPTMGIVKAISVRSTTIETFDKTDVIVPNADLIAGTVTNWTRGNTIGRAVVLVGVAYGSDTRHVQKVLLEIARGHPDVAKYPEPGVDFLGFGADSLDFRVRMILRDINKLVAVKTEVHHQIAERFKAEGIEIPFRQRDIWLRNPEALHALAEPVARTAPPEKDQPA